MKIIPFLLPLALALLAASCCLDEEHNCQRALGPNVTREMDLPPMDGIALNLPAEVVLRQGSAQHILVTGPENLVDDLEGRVINGIWDIETDQCWRDFDRLGIDITLPNFRSLAINGVGDMLSLDTLTVDELNISMSGTGRYDLNLIAQRVNAEIAGAGDVELHGQGQELFYELSGTGRLEAYDFPVDFAELHISGAGDARLTVMDLLRVRLSGTGDVLYRGDPVLDVMVTGAGDVIPAP